MSLSHTSRPPSQEKLFDTAQSLPNGLVYRPHFITPNEEETILHYLTNLPLEHGSYTIRSIGETITTKRRMLGFGWNDTSIPRWLEPLRGKVAKWLDVPKSRITSALINEYIPGTGMGWHRDEGNIEHVVGISFGSWATMRFRPYSLKNRSEIIAIEMERRSAYIMQKQVHWSWQHSVMPVKHARYSITFRTVFHEAYTFEPATNPVVQHSWSE